MEIFAGYYTDKNKIRSPSRGAATMFAKLIIKTGGIVYGVVFAPDFYSARFDYAESMDDLEKFKGSKYCVVEKRA